MAREHRDFEAFWEHFVLSHTQPATQWMHTAGVFAWLAGMALSARRRSAAPFVAGSAVFAAFAVGAHPLFERSLPQNGGHPLWGIAGNLRMAWHTLNGTMSSEVARAQRRHTPSE